MVDVGEVGIEVGLRTWLRAARNASSSNAIPRGVPKRISEIIDATGDGACNTLDGPRGVAADAAGNVYVAGQVSDNVFKVAVKEPGVSGVTFTLTGGSLAAPVVEMTNAGGEFWFEDLAPGIYTVTETVPAAYVSTTGDTVVVTIGPGEEAVAFPGQAMLGPGQYETVNNDLFFGNDLV